MLEAYIYLLDTKRQLTWVEKITSFKMGKTASTNNTKKKAALKFSRGSTKTKASSNVAQKSDENGEIDKKKKPVIPVAVSNSGWSPSKMRKEAGGNERKRGAGNSPMHLFKIEALKGLRLEAVTFEDDTGTKDAYVARLFTYIYNGNIDGVSYPNLDEKIKELGILNGGAYFLRDNRVGVPDNTFLVEEKPDRYGKNWPRKTILRTVDEPSTTQERMQFLYQLLQVRCQNESYANRMKSRFSHFGTYLFR